MKLGLHAYSLMLAGGLREYKPVGRGPIRAGDLLDIADDLDCAALQLARCQIPTDLVELANLGGNARDRRVLLHFSTGSLEREELECLIRSAQIAGVTQVNVGLACLTGNVEQRRQRLETLLKSLDPVIKLAERYQVTLAIENGRHVAAADLAAFIQAAQSERVKACVDPANALTVPESPDECAKTLAPYAACAHLKDFQVYRCDDGVMLVNTPLGDGSLDHHAVLRELHAKNTDLPLFVQTVAERVHVPILDDRFLQDYPRITARALAGLLRRGVEVFDPDAHKFPHENRTREKDVLKWEEARLRQSLDYADTLLGKETMTLFGAGV